MAIGMCVGALFVTLLPLIFRGSATSASSVASATSGGQEGSDGFDPVDDATGIASAAGDTGDRAADDSTGTGTGAGADGTTVTTPQPARTGANPTPGGSTPDRAEVSTEPIRVGILLLNIGNIASFGFGGGPGLSAEDQQRVWQGLIDDINAAGGVNGHLIDPVFEPYNVLSPDDMNRACLVLTQEAEAFVVLDAGGYTGPPVLCVTKQNGVPFVLTASSGIPDEYYRQSNGLLFTIFQAGGRSMQNMVSQLGAAGVDRRQPVGILSDRYGGIKETPDQLEAALGAAGYDVVYRNDLSGDLQTGATQIPLAVQQMRVAGAEVVVNIANALYATQFVQEAASQGWQPHYVQGDWNGGSTDFYNQNMPPSFDGSHVVTITRINEGRAGYPEPDVDGTCRERSAESVATTVERDTDAYGQYVRICSVMSLARRALEAAGPQPSTAGFQQALSSLGPVPLPGFGGGAFDGTRPDAANRVRLMQWSADCTCSLPITDFVPTPN